MLADFRYGCRSLLRSPGFTTANVLMLGLGIGATIAVLALLDAVLLRPLPLSEPDRTVTLHTQFERIRGASGELFEAVAGSGSSGMRVTTPAGARTVSVTFVAERRRPVARHAGGRAGYLRPASPGHYGPRCARGHAERSRAATLATGVDLHGRPGVREDRRPGFRTGEPSAARPLFSGRCEQPWFQRPQRVEGRNRRAFAKLVLEFQHAAAL